MLCLELSFLHGLLLGLVIRLFCLLLLLIDLLKVLINGVDNVHLKLIGKADVLFVGLICNSRDCGGVAAGSLGSARPGRPWSHRRALLLIRLFLNRDWVRNIELSGTYDLNGGFASCNVLLTLHLL